MLPEKLYNELKGLDTEGFKQIEASLIAEYGEDDVKYAYKYPLKVDNLQGVIIKRDIKGMKVIDSGLFEETFNALAESGEKAAFKFVLSMLSAWGYRLDRGLIMLELVNSEVKKNEIKFNCEYPINMNSRIDPNSLRQVTIIKDEGDWDDRFQLQWYVTRS